MGALSSTAMTSTGERPEAIEVSERSKNMKIQHSGDSKTGMKSYAAQSAEDAQNAKKAFIFECTKRGTLFATEQSEALYANPEILQRVCTEYLEFCYSNKVSMTLTNLALWLGVHKETLSRVLRNGDIDPRYETLKTMVDIMDYSMEQELALYEGNNTGKIYLTKSRLGWQEAAQQVDINIGLQQPTYTKPDSLPQALDIIDITPDIE